MIVTYYMTVADDLSGNVRVIEVHTDPLILTVLDCTTSIDECSDCHWIVPGTFDQLYNDAPVKDNSWMIDYNIIPIVD